MAIIDIGSPAIDRDYEYGVGTTLVAMTNSADGIGKITSIEIWAHTDITNCEVATFYVVSGNNLSTRDSENIGTVTAGAKRTFTVDLDVEIGDYIGLYLPSGNIDYGAGTGGFWTLSGDQIPCTDQTFTLTEDWIISLYGTGVTKEDNAIFMGCNF